MIKQLVFVLCLLSSSYFKDKQDLVKQTSCKGYYDKGLDQFVYTEVDKMPEYPGGITKFYKFISNVPLNGTDNERLQSTVFPTFVIDAYGRVKSVGIYQKLSKDYTQLDRNMIKLLKTCANWEPARCNNKKVAMRSNTGYLVLY